MYPLWELLAEVGISESFRKAMERMIKLGKDPRKEAIDKIFSGSDILGAYKNKIISVMKETITECEVKDKSHLNKDFLIETTRKKFQYLFHPPNEEETKKIEAVCEEVFKNYSIALKTILEDPFYEILKILMETHLPEIECILKKDEIKKPELFRENPIWVDFEEDYFVKREKRVKKVLQALETHNIHVVYGVPTSGKSNFVKYLGFELAKKNCVFYIGLKEHEIAGLFEDIKKIINRQDCILIIDDAHLNLKEIQTLIDIGKNKTLKIIISTRPLSEEHYTTHTSDRLQEYIRDKKYSTELSPEEILDELIEKYSEKNHVKIPSHVRSGIKKEYGKDLWILYWALKAYEEKGEISKEYIYEEITKERFDKYEYEHGKYLEYVGEIFYYISLFSKYEFPVEKRFIRDEIDKENLDKFEKLSKSREFIETEKNRIMLHHSSIARIYLETLYLGTYGEFIPVKKDKIEIFSEYIRKYSERGIELIGTLGNWQYKEYRLVKNLVFKIEIGKVTKAIDRSDDIGAIGWCVYSILEADPDAGKSLVSHISLPTLAEKIDRSDDVRAVGVCISSILKADPDAGKSLVSHISLPTLAEKIDRSDDVRAVGVCISSILKADPDAGKSLVSHISLPTLAEKIDRSDDVRAVGACISSILEADPDAGKSLVSQISLPTLAEKIDRSDDVRAVGVCISSILKADPDAGKSLVSQISLPTLAEKIDRSEDIGAIGLCVSSIYIADPDAGKSLLENVARAIDRSDDVRAVGVCISSILKADPDAGKSLLENVARAIARAIDRSDDVRAVGVCISSIYIADPDAGKKLINLIKRKYIDFSTPP